MYEITMSRIDPPFKDRSNIHKVLRFTAPLWLDKLEKNSFYGTTYSMNGQIIESPFLLPKILERKYVLSSLETTSYAPLRIDTEYLTVDIPKTILKIIGIIMFATLYYKGYLPDLSTIKAKLF